MSVLWKRRHNDDFSRSLHPSGDRSYVNNTLEWKSLFESTAIIGDGLKQAEEAQGLLHARLSRVLDIFNQVTQRQGKLLQKVIEAVDFCEGMNPRPVEIEAIHNRLLAVLQDEGVSTWSINIGEPMPEGCEPVAEKASSEFPPGTVLAMVLPGYLWDKTVLLRRPRVVISKSMPQPEEPAVDKVALVPSSGDGEKTDTPAGKAFTPIMWLREIWKKQPKSPSDQSTNNPPQDRPS